MNTHAQKEAELRRLHDMLKNGETLDHGQPRADVIFEELQRCTVADLKALAAHLDLEVSIRAVLRSLEPKPIFAPQGTSFPDHPMYPYVTTITHT